MNTWLRPFLWVGRAVGGRLQAPGSNEEVGLGGAYVVDLANVHKAFLIHGSAWKAVQIERLKLKDLQRKGSRKCAAAHKLIRSVALASKRVGVLVCNSEEPAGTFDGEQTEREIRIMCDFWDRPFGVWKFWEASAQLRHHRHFPPQLEEADFFHSLLLRPPLHQGPNFALSPFKTVAYAKHR